MKTERERECRMYKGNRRKGRERNKRGTLYLEGVGEACERAQFL